MNRVTFYAKGFFNRILKLQNLNLSSYPSTIYLVQYKNVQYNTNSIYKHILLLLGGAHAQEAHRVTDLRQP